MNKRVFWKRVLAMVFVAAIVLGTVACGRVDDSPAQLKGVHLKSAPAKTDYFVGEELQLDGALITAQYSDGSEKEVEVSADMNILNRHSGGRSAVSFGFSPWIPSTMMTLFLAIFSFSPS